MSDVSSSVPEILQANIDFTKKIYRILSINEGNLLFCPITIHVLLSTMYNGANGKTAENLSKFWNISGDIRSGYKEIFVRLKSLKEDGLIVANKMYIDKSKNFTFHSDCCTEVESVDYQNITDAINQWVAKVTDDKIEEIEETFDELKSLLLLSVFYFKGIWSTKFYITYTQTQKFFLDNDEVIDVKMMKGDKMCCYFKNEDLKASIVEQSFNNHKMSFLLFLPFEKNGIKKLEGKLTNIDLNEILKRLSVHEMTISLPRFKIDQTINFKEIFLEMGFKDIFNEENSDLGGIVDGGQVCVDKIVQKAFIGVEEEGVHPPHERQVDKGPELCDIYIKGPPRADFVVDHPAIFMVILEQGSAVNVLCCGRLSHPEDLYYSF